MLLDVNKLMDKKLEKETADNEKRTEILRQVIAIIEERAVNFLKVGTFVYVKSSVTAPDGKPQFDDRDSLRYYTYKYKIYHPAFPHEPTSDQFFDAVQWESYFQLGQFIGAEVLGDDELIAFSDKPKTAFSIEELLDHFDQKTALFKAPPELKPERVLEKTASKTIAPEQIEQPAAVETASGIEPETIPSGEVQPEQEAKEEKVILGEEVQYKM